jgi:hypothetical protein
LMGAGKLAEFCVAIRDALDIHVRIIKRKTRRRKHTTRGYRGR